jgi:hypothetical protein
MSNNNDNRSAAHHRPTTNTSCTLQCTWVCIPALRPSCTINRHCPPLLLAETAAKSKITETDGAQDEIMTAPKRPHLDLSNSFVRLHESFKDILNRPRPQRAWLNFCGAEVTFSMLSCSNEKRLWGHCKTILALFFVLSLWMSVLGTVLIVLRFH